MNIETTAISGVMTITPTVYEDDRGYFKETYRANDYCSRLNCKAFVQENESFSKAGTIRGIHFQRWPYSQAKLVRVAKGAVLDYAVDLRRDSPTYLHWIAELLTDKNHTMLYLPEYCGHMFVALEDSVFQYKCTNYYFKAAESGIRWNDPRVGITFPADFRIDPTKLIFSEKDQFHPLITDSTDFGFKYV